MKICFIAPANNYHTKKWCNWFLNRGHEIHVISFIDEMIPDVFVHYIDAKVQIDGTDFAKVRYLCYAHKIKKFVSEINPDIVHVHYATSYGTATALSGIKPYILSVWGSDIYDFPEKSFLHKLMLKYSLSGATYLFSTSKAMAVQAAKYTKKHFKITPFGVDMKLFHPGLKIKNNETYVIGTVKGLSDKYGIEYLLKAVAIIKKERPDLPLQVRIAGKGPKEQDYKLLAEQLQINNIVMWLGFISQKEAALEWANMDIAVIPSTMESESFGVSAVEAEACGTPVIISDVAGLMEATDPSKTSIVVKRKDEFALAYAIMNLIDNETLRYEMGRNGRLFVQKHFDLDRCFSKIERFFYEIK